MDELWEVYALKYARNPARLRRDNFIMDDDHAAPMPIEFFVWMLVQPDTGRRILVDTGFDRAEAAARGREIERDPTEVLDRWGVPRETLSEVIVTHLHFDHAGGLDRYPNARFHLQAAEMAYATGPCMCHDALRHPFTAAHVCEMVRHVYSGRVVFHDGDGAVAPGVTVHRIGGHSRGLQAVRVKTREGWLCLASDAAHFYETYLRAKPFVLVVDVEDMLEGFRRIQALASAPHLVIPGHDPAVREIFPEVLPGLVHRLDVAVERFDPLGETA